MNSLRPGQQATFFYRIAHSLVTHHVPILPTILTWFGFLLSGAEISPRAELGPGFHIAHSSGIVIGYGVKVGKNCDIFQQVTLGNGNSKHRGMGFPTIGDNVTIYAGAKVFGRIHVGSNVTIGANAVVLDDIPDNCTAVGVPARIIH